MNAKKTAYHLVKSGFTIAKYEELQQERRRRLQTFKEFNIPVLINEAEKLVAFGDEVIDEMTIIILNIMLKEND